MQEEGMLVVADLTDPLLSAEEANGIFEVLLDQFRSNQVVGGTEGGKLLVLDEAHRYVSGTDTDGLSRSIVDAVRLMRHEGLRVAISTQSPKVLAPELLELVSLLLVHRFHSEDWFTYLKSKVPLPPGGFETIRGLATGQALVFAASHDQARILKSTLYCDFLL
jgi:DNA helicase HerA-like ATPase